MNHKIGDIITVASFEDIYNRSIDKSNVRWYDSASAYFTPIMQVYCGQSFIVTNIHRHGYDVADNDYTFSDYMLTSFNNISELTEIQPYEYW